MRRVLPAALALALVAAACAGAGDDPAPEAETAALLPEDRLALPTYDLETFQEMLRELEGTPVVVNIWASWCAPCRVEAPHLATLARDYDSDVRFVGVDILDERGAAKDFILEFDWPYPSVFDPRAEIRDGLGYIGQPVTFIVDRNGDVVFEWQGAITEDLLREEIEKVLA